MYVYLIHTYYMSLWFVIFLFVGNVDTVLYLRSIQAVLLEKLVQ